MTTTGEQLLRTILLHPDDDGGRLVYADWLEQEAGQQERAEFIRVQIELAGMVYCPACDHRYRPAVTPPLPKPACPGCRYMKQFYRLKSRERHFLASPCRFCAWHAPIPHGGGRWEFRRGFIESVTYTCQGWLEQGPAVVAAHPIQRVTLVDRESYRNAAGYYLWESGKHPTAVPESVIPAELYPMIAGHKYDPHHNNSFWKAFPSFDAALNALSAAALLWARRQAGLEVQCQLCEGRGEFKARRRRSKPRTCPDCSGKGWRAATAWGD